MLISDITYNMCVGPAHNIYMMSTINDRKVDKYVLHV